jgi:serine protease Do
MRGAAMAADRRAGPLARWWALAAAVACAGACRERVEPAPVVAPDAGPKPVVVDAAVVDAEPGAPTRLGYGAGSLAELVAAAAPSVVALRAKAPVRNGPAAMFPGGGDGGGDVALGTAFVIEHRGQFLLTTDRVAAAAADLLVVLPAGAMVPARVIGRDPRLDVALLSFEVPPAFRVPALVLGSSDELVVGERLVVLGNAFGDEVTASSGIVAATGRDAAATSPTGSPVASRSLMQTDARIHRGNSGGPVLDLAGRVVGIATATADRPTELSLVIPMSRVREVLEGLREHGRVTRSWLGALVQPPPASMAVAGPWRGAVVTQLVPGSPAEKSELAVGDVIMRWGDRAVDHRTLPPLVANSPAGQPVRVTVRRGDTELIIEVSPEPMPQR